MKMIEKFAAAEAKYAEEYPEFKAAIESVCAATITAYRKSLNMTQAEVAKQLNISRASIIAIEAGKEPVPAGLVSFYAHKSKVAEAAWGLDTAELSFIFVNKVSVYSEWVDFRRLDLRYYIAQTRAKVNLDPTDSEEEVRFGIFCSDHEVAEPTGDCPQTIAQAEEMLTKQGFAKAATFIEVTEEEANEEREGAEIDLAALFSKIKINAQ